MLLVKSAILSVTLLWGWLASQAAAKDFSENKPRSAAMHVYSVLVSLILLAHLVAQ